MPIQRGSFGSWQVAIQSKFNPLSFQGKGAEFVEETEREGWLLVKIPAGANCLLFINSLCGIYFYPCHLWMILMCFDVLLLGHKWWMLWYVVRLVSKIFMSSVKTYLQDCLVPVTVIRLNNKLWIDLNVLSIVRWVNE